MEKVRHLTYLLLSTLLFMTPYSIAPWGNGNTYKDNIIFMKCAQWMGEGQIIYKDIFDHKGPLLYFYNMLGLSISEKHGIWILDWLLVILTVYYIYKCATIILNSKESLIVVGISLFIMNIPFVKDGNSELLAMPATAIGCYLFIKQINRMQPYSLFEAFILCVLFTICLMTKPNTGSAFIPIILYGVFVLISQRKYVLLAKTIISGLIGLCISVIPVLYYLYCNDALRDFYDVYIEFNTSGYAEVSFMTKLMLISKISFFASVGYFIFIFWGWNNRNTWTLSHCFVTILFLFSITFNLFTGYCFRHYMLPCIPVFGILLTLLMKNIRKKQLLILCGLSFIIGGIHFVIRTCNYLSKIDNAKEIECANYINSHCSNNDKIIILELHGWERENLQDNDIVEYVDLWKFIKCKSASRFFYQYPPFYSRSDYEQEFLNDITVNKPQFIVCGSSHNKTFLKLGYSKCQDTKFNILQRDNI